MPMLENHNGEWDLDTLESADKIRKDPARMANIQKAANNRKELADKLSGKKPNPENDMATKGFTVLPG